MEKIKLPYSSTAYLLAIFSCILFFLGGSAIIMAIISYTLAHKAKDLYSYNPSIYTGYRKAKKTKRIARIGILLNIIVLGITIWMLSTVGRDAWVATFVRKWNEGL